MEDPWLLFTAAAALIWLMILALPWQPWRNREVLESTGLNENSDLQEVTVVIPARNEAAVVGATLRALSRQGQNLQIILVDDASTDGTAKAAREAGGDALRLITGRPLPGRDGAANCGRRNRASMRWRRLIPCFWTPISSLPPA